MTAVATRTPARHSTLRRYAVWGVPVLFTVGWLLFVLIAGHGGRVVDNWRAALTMVFGSFVAGSTPQGGGAVAFPVFTKVLEVPAPVARSFSLVIQATGMVMASISILLAGRKVDWRALGLGVLGGGTGFVIGLFALGDPATPFWSPRIDAAYVKVAFTIVIFAVAVIVRTCIGRTTKYERVQDWGARSVAVMLAFAFVGGVFSSLAGSGADVMLFVFIVLVAQVSPRVAIPTSIITMATVSVLGLAILGLWHGQLDITLDGSQVVAVGGEPFGPESATRFDLFGIWIAAAPVVVWGAPFGAWLAAKLPERVVILFVAAMALLEVVTTTLFLDALRTDVTLATFFVVGLLLAYVGVQRLDRLSTWIMTD
ncbi:MAG: TSUP family transporter [Actinomycetota bacterium]